jgi:ECF transporter S component (folate family)
MSRVGLCALIADLQCLPNGELSEGRKAFAGLRYKVRIPLLHKEKRCKHYASCCVAVLHNRRCFYGGNLVHQFNGKLSQIRFIMKGEVKLKNSSLYVRRITISAVFLSISLVLNTISSFYIPMFGENGMSIGISGIFSVMPSILFGPVYGAAVSGLSDFLGYLLKPVGTYIPLVTLVVAAGGFIRGALWIALRNKDSKKMRIAVAVFSAFLLLAGICNIAFLSADGIDNGFYDHVQKENISTDNMHLVSKMLISRTIDTNDPSGNLATYITFATAGIIGSAALGILLLAADLFISKKFLRNKRRGQISQLLIAMIGSGLIVTTLNTVVLRETIFTAWKVLPFAVIWIPRVIEEILGNTVKAYFVAMLLGAFRKHHGLSELMDGTSIAYNAERNKEHS